MDEMVKKEVETIFIMVNRWKIFWLREYREPGEFPGIDNPNAWILDEFMQLCVGGDYYQHGHVLPYFRRLHEIGALTDLEYRGVLERLGGEIDDMRRLLGLPEPTKREGKSASENSK